MIIPGSPLHKKPTLGLDLQGGLEVVLKAEPPKDRSLTQSDLNRSVDIMRNRVDKLGVSEPEIRKQGTDQIVIELPGVKNAEAASSIIGKTAQLELYDLETSVLGPSAGANFTVAAFPKLPNLLERVQPQVGKSASAYYLFDKRGLRVVGPVSTRQKILDSRVIRRNRGKIPKGWNVLGVPQGMVVVSCGPSEVVCPGVNEAPPRRTYYYLFKFQPDANPPVPQMTGQDLKLSGTRQDIDPQTGQPEVLMQFTGAGGKKFQDVTAAEYDRGKLQRVPQHFAIVLDREIKSFPQIDYTDSSLAGG